jgi:sec-independent protein translocase protein TatB
VFDFSVWELVVIGGVALVVIGPERLPRVARTAGHLLGRFQRYVADVKSDINREIELAELKKLQTSVQDAAREIEQTVRESASEAQRHLQEAEGEIKSAGEELKKAEREIASGFTPPHMGTAAHEEPAALLATESTSFAEPVPALEPVPEVEYDPRAAALNPNMAAAYAAAKAKLEKTESPGSTDAAEESSPQLELGLPSELDTHHKPG